MAKDRGKITEAKRLRDPDGSAQFITMGEVVDTNDPQQMGRLRVACPLFSELGDDVIGSIPWAMYASPFGGITTTPSRGRGDDKTPGEVAYGMFNIPKVGSNVLVAFIDGDPRNRVWLGCVYDQYKPHTLPHGRYSYQTKEKPDGPFSSSEDKIQPLYDSQTEAFKKATTQTIDASTPTDEPRKSFEFRTRSADVSAAGLDEELVLDLPTTSLADDFSATFTEDDGNEITNTQGYKKSRVESNASAANTKDDILYDPQTYSWTTPGFHSISMTDSAENCRIRVRTTQGHQIIFDDTNERIYVSTAGGKTWIEMDEKGNMDVYAERNLSFHAEQDINFTTEKAFRVKAKEGVHLESETEMRLHAKTDMHIKSGTSLNFHTDDNINIYAALDVNIDTPNNILITTGQDVDILSGSLIVETATDIDMKSGADVIVESAVNISIKAGEEFIGEGKIKTSLLAEKGNVVLTGAEIHLNGPPASSGTSASGASGSAPQADATLESFWTSRVPEHEPWARTMTDQAKTDGDKDNSHEPELPYTDKNVGKTERGAAYVPPRNPKWHR